MFPQETLYLNGVPTCLLIEYIYIFWNTCFRIVSEIECSHIEVFLENCWGRLSDDGDKVNALNLTCCSTDCWSKIVWTCILWMTLPILVVCYKILYVIMWLNFRSITPSPKCELERPWSELYIMRILCPLFIVYSDRFKFSLFQSGPLSVSLLIIYLSYQLRCVQATAINGIALEMLASSYFLLWFWLGVFQVTRWWWIVLLFWEYW